MLAARAEQLSARRVGWERRLEGGCGGNFPGDPVAKTSCFQ